VQVDGLQHPDQKLHSMRREVQVELLIDLRRPGACIDEFGGIAEDAAVGVAELEPPAVGRKRHKKRFSDLAGDRPARVFEQVKNNFTRRRRRRIDQFDIAQVETLGWSTSAGTFEDGLGNETPGGASRSLKTPTTPEAYPVIVRAESKSRQGLRSSGEPTRVGILTIRTGGSITIEPSHACIEPGETQQFIAIVTGLDNYTVNWNKLEGYGNIDENGLYTSLSGGTSSAIIEATVVERPEMKDEATVAVNSCVCSLDVTIGGHSSWSHASSDVAYLVSDFGDLFYQFYFEIGGSETQGIGASLTGTETVAAPRPGDTGTWRANFVYFDGSGSWVSIWDDENGITGVSVTIDELTDAFMTGTFHGQAVQLRLDGKTVISFVDVFVQFRAGNWDGGRWPCVE